jgi:phenylacetic acid degradation operon negative regulatory protein
MAAADSLASDRPSLRSGSTSQGLLLTLIGDYWWGQPMYIPSAALVALLKEFDISDQAARAALSRVQRAGYLVGERDGRRTMYRLSPESANRAVTSGRRIMQFTAETADAASGWNGRWTIVTYALQTDQVDERREIRRRLRRLGFGPLQDAVWVSPRVTAVQLRKGFDADHAQAVTVFEHARLAEADELDVVRVWELDELAARYDSILAQLREILPLVRARSDPSPEVALTARTEAMQEWRKMPAIDPRLPSELLPADWPGWEARRLFAEVYDALGPLAAQRVRDVIAPHSEVAAAAVHFDAVAAPR